jgi:hypothetical protein
MADTGFDLITLIPLYGFSADLEAIQLADGIFVTKFHDSVLDTPFGEWKDLTDFCRLFPPTYFLIKVSRNAEGWLDFVDGENGTEILRKFDLEFEFKKIQSWVTALRLFKPGALREGGSWNLAIGAHTHNNKFISAEKSFMRPENAMVYGRVTEVGYKLEAEEVPFIRAFRQKLDDLIELAVRAPRFKVALDYFNFSFSSKGPEYQLIDLVVCLEALFLTDEGEMNRTLALRVASLLGVDADERRRIHGELRNFYGTRSKVLHGVPLKEKQLKELDQLSRLRELTRKAVLAALALGADIGFDSSYFAALDEMVLDDDRRREYQGKAHKLLFMDS